MTQTLFVYGTLMQASKHPMARRLASESRLLGSGSIAGKLFSLGSYPGFIEDESGRNRVYGEAVQLNSLRSFAWLDDYEGCGPRWPEPHDYQRKLLPVSINRGTEITCWVYVYRQRVEEARWIPNGRFMPV